MKHVGLIFFALLAAAVGVLILVLSHCATAVAISAGSFFVVLSIALAVPAQLAQAKDTLSTLALAIKAVISASRQ